MKPLISWEAKRRPRKPKVRRGVRKLNEKRGGHRFPKNVVPELREWVAKQKCLLVGLVHQETKRPHACWPPIECAHVKARGAGAPDWDNVIPLCANAHRALHFLGPRTFMWIWQIHLTPLARKATAAFLKAHPEGRKGKAEA